MRAMQEEGRVNDSVNSVPGGPRPLPRRAVVRCLSTMHMMGFTPLGFFETVSEGANLVEGAMSLPYAGEVAVDKNLLTVAPIVTSRHIVPLRIYNGSHLETYHI